MVVASWFFLPIQKRCSCCSNLFPVSPMVGLPGFLNGLMSCPVVRSHIFPYPNLDAHRCGLILFHYFIASFQVGELLLVPISEWQISTRRRCHVEPFCGSPAALLPQSKKVSSIIFQAIIKILIYPNFTTYPHMFQSNTHPRYPLISHIPHPQQVPWTLA